MEVVRFKNARSVGGEAAAALEGDVENAAPGGDASMAASAGAGGMYTEATGTALPRRVGRDRERPPMSATLAEMY